MAGAGRIAREYAELIAIAAFLVLREHDEQRAVRFAER